MLHKMLLLVNCLLLLLLHCHLLLAIGLLLDLLVHHLHAAGLAA